MHMTISQSPTSNWLNSTENRVGEMWKILNLPLGQTPRLFEIIEKQRDANYSLFNYKIVEISNRFKTEREANQVIHEYSLVFKNRVSGIFKLHGLSDDDLIYFVVRNVYKIPNTLRGYPFVDRCLLEAVYDPNLSSEQ